MNLTKGIKHVFMDQAGADGAAGSGGASAGAGGSGAASAEPGAPTGQGGASSGGASSALASAAGAAGAAGGEGQQAGTFDWIPEKHRVSKDDGSFDLEASARKVAAAHGALEQRLGSGDVPPKDAAEYAPEVQLEGFNWDEFKADPEMQGFLKSAHSKGITNAQLSFILGEHYQRSIAIAQGAQALNIEQCETELSKSWTTPEAMTAGKAAAFKAFSAFADKAGVSLQELEASGAANNPAVIKLLAAIAPELGEDVGINGAGAGGQETIEQLLAHPAYADAKHAEHKIISEKVRKYYEKQYGTAPAI